MTRSPSFAASFFAQEKTRLMPKLAPWVVALMLSVTATGATATGFPTFDFANLMEGVATVTKLKDQILQMKQQYKKLDQQYQAVTGNRGLGVILNDPSLSNHLPRQWQGVYQQVKSGRMPGISDQFRRIQSAESMASAPPGQQRYEETLAANGAIAMRGYEATMTRLDNIQKLMKRSDLTQDAAAKADLQNRLSAEMAMVNNEQTRLQLMGQLAEVEMQLAARQELREFHRGTFLQGVR